MANSERVINPHFNTVDLSDAEYFQQIDDLVAKSQVEFRPYHLDRLTKTRVAYAGYNLRGFGYFRDLYTPEDTSSNFDKLRSIFTGAVAFGKPEFAEAAYETLSQMFLSSEELNNELISSLDEAIFAESQFGNSERRQRLEKSAKVLGKPLSKRILGHIITGLAMHGRSA